MSSNGQYGGASEVSEAEKTLRMIAQLPAPEGLEGRVRAVLKAGKPAGQVLAWPTERQAVSGSVWSGSSARSGQDRTVQERSRQVHLGQVRSGWLRGAAAAAIVCLIGGGAWGIYARVVPLQSARTIALPHAMSSSGFSNAGAMRTPQTLVGPAAPHAASTPIKPVQTTAPKANGSGKAPGKKLVVPAVAGASPVAH
jgi:hypothetical protein